ncbi:MAG TPA: nucleotidyltransferase domain-containing protein [Geobacteraceae bacterium]|nr:nucleotidyltransferase domain-containing protein [Geobacteraceae bacterium]
MFGSHARKEAGTNSDIDILVVETNVKNRFAWMVRLNRSFNPLRITFDLFVVSEEMPDYGQTRPATSVILPA